MIHQNIGKDIIAGMNFRINNIHLNIPHKPNHQMNILNILKNMHNITTFHFDFQLKSIHLNKLYNSLKKKKNSIIK